MQVVRTILRKGIGDEEIDYESLRRVHDFLSAIAFIFLGKIVDLRG